MKAITIKEVINSDNWIIKKVKQGYNGKVRIDAQGRFPRANQINFFSGWCNFDYANRIYKERYGKEIQITEY